MNWLRHGLGGGRRPAVAPLPVRPGSDARPVEGHPKQLERDPAAGRRARRRRRAASLLVGSIIIAGSLAAVFGKGGSLDLLRLRRERGQAQAMVDAVAARVAALQEQVRALEEEPMARERIAREQLGYARPGEITFILPDNEGTAADPERERER